MLPKTIRFLSLDLAGHGRFFVCPFVYLSSVNLFVVRSGWQKSRCYHLVDYVADGFEIVNLICAKEDKGCVLIGHSLGGSVAMMVASLVVTTFFV